MRQCVSVAMLAACFALAPMPVWADRLPPPNALPLSQIVRMLEDRLNPAYFHEIEWDDDGYWEVEYVDRRGTKVKIKVDPVTGQHRPDR